MCGIAGIVGGGVPRNQVLVRMAEAMAHRGPDGQGTWRDDHAGLAFRRLAVIDLDHRSDQPLHLGPWHLVFNGEIYNYRELRVELERLGHAFLTEGDGEVLLHAWAQWEEGSLRRLEGMYAFAVWHDARRRLTLARDPFGEKPLFWARDGERLVFASELGALRPTAPRPPTAREAALAPYLARGLMPPIDQSFLAGVRRLPAGHLLRFDAEGVEVARHWAPRAVEPPATYPEAVEALRAALTDSIRLRLRSDVPVGTSLSGGVDSSAIVGLAAGLAGDHTRHAFTARFPGYARDEWRYAAEVAAAAGVVKHHEVEPTPAQLLEDLDDLLAVQAEPVGSLSVYAQWRVMRAARDAGVTVLLDGQGADEVLGGYEGTAGWAARTRGAPAVLRGLAGADRREVLLALGAERMPAAVRRRHRRGLSSPYASAHVIDAAVGVDAPLPAGGRSRDPLRRELLRQAFHTSLPELLRYADRDSMAHGRETRLPFLDRGVVELALSLPPAFLLRGGLRKAVLRDAVRDVVPASVLDRRDKIGFEPPQDAWLADEGVRARMAEVLLDPGARTAPLVDRGTLEADVAAGRWRDARAAWRVFNLELWLRGVERPAPEPVAATV
jgi:asparagine synthase (glutamine-hydrolysing)